MINIKLLAGIAIFLVIYLAGSSIVNQANEFISEQLYGPEYCFESSYQSTIALASQGVELKYTESGGDNFCFRTKDISFVERISKQIQERKLQENIAKIEANKQTSITLIIAVTVIIIAIIIYMSTGRNYGGYY